MDSPFASACTSVFDGNLFPCLYSLKPVSSHALVFPHGFRLHESLEKIKAALVVFGQPLKAKSTDCSSHKNPHELQAPHTKCFQYQSGRKFVATGQASFVGVIFN